MMRTMTIVGQHSACVAEVSIQRKDDCQNKLKFLVFLFGMEIIALTQNCAYILSLCCTFIRESRRNQAVDNTESDSEYDDIVDSEY